ncbi:MAG: hypothetical protein FWG70_01060 [Oscillospiraceae bacterium]|nr:hypothetical protein [Oscillospiraceae bacterium]
MTGMWDSLTASMFTGIVQDIIGLLPIVLPAVVGLLALRKGLNFVFGMIRGA